MWRCGSPLRDVRCRNAAAINRSDTLIASEVDGGTAVVDTALNNVRLLIGIDGGVVFDPVSDILYGVNSTTDQIVAFDTATWQVRFTMPVDQSTDASTPMETGVMAVSGDGTKLFLSTPTGVRRYDLPTSTGAANRTNPVNVNARVSSTTSRSGFQPPSRDKYSQTVVTR